MNIITALLSNLNYPTIFFLMLLESTVVPVPSEFVVTPAAYHAASGSLNVFLIILFATLGADVGASINYFVALYVGRPVVYKFANSKLGHLCLLNQEKVEKSEKYFDDHGVAATLTGRFVPVIRHLISIPAGIAKMPLAPFTIFTALGAGVWTAILAAAGYAMGRSAGDISYLELCVRGRDAVLSHLPLVIVCAILFIAAYAGVSRLVMRRTNVRRTRSRRQAPMVCT